jgi:Sel1 repeat
MKTLIKVIMLTIVTGLSASAFAAGDYIWEEKFKRELPKAEQGNAKSQYSIGEMYEKGKGAERDAQKAFQWYQKAAKQGNKKAAYKIGLSYLEGKGAKKNYNNAYKWLKKSATKNYVRAQYYLGVIYEKGKGVSKDNQEALKWYKQALAGGYGSAAEAVKRASKSQESKKVSSPSRPAVINRPKTAPAVKPTVVVKPATKPLKKPAGKRSNTQKKILAGDWERRNKPSEYLPSTITQCKNKGKTVQCLSSELIRNIGMADIKYTTKATLFDFKRNGSFKVTYQNKVSKINITEPDFAESGGKVPVTLGWQDAKHQLSCTFENELSLVCFKNKTRKMTFNRAG